MNKTYKQQAQKDILQDGKPQASIGLRSKSSQRKCRRDRECRTLFTANYPRNTYTQQDAENNEYRFSLAEPGE